jgi:hypothetical protein
VEAEKLLCLLMAVLEIVVLSSMDLEERELIFVRMLDTFCANITTLVGIQS